MLTVELVGINQFQMFVTVNIKKFGGNELALASAVKEDLACPGSSPLNKSDQVISANKRDGGMKVRAPDPGLQKKIQSQRASERASREGGPEGHELVSERASLRAVREQVSVDVAPVVLGQRGYFPHIGQ